VTSGDSVPPGRAPGLPRSSDVELLDSRELHDGRIFRVLAERVRLPSGLEQSLDVVLHPGAVGIAAVDEGGKLVLVRQYRHPLGRWTVEIPAGRLEPGESPERAARRELEEETGLHARSWRLLRSIAPAPGFCSEIVHVFEARDLAPAPGGGRPADPDEELSLVHLPPAEVLAGDVDDAKTLVAAALLLLGTEERGARRGGGPASARPER
jgi:ADP-ribose pyrophosphatase